MSQTVTGIVTRADAAESRLESRLSQLVDSDKTPEEQIEKMTQMMESTKATFKTVGETIIDGRTKGLTDEEIEANAIEAAASMITVERNFDKPNKPAGMPSSAYEAMCETAKQEYMQSDEYKADYEKIKTTLENAPKDSKENFIGGLMGLSNDTLSAEIENLDKTELSFTVDENGNVSVSTFTANENDKTAVSETLARADGRTMEELPTGEAEEKKSMFEWLKSAATTFMADKLQAISEKAKEFNIDDTELGSKIVNGLDNLSDKLDGTSTENENKGQSLAKMAALDAAATAGASVSNANAKDADNDYEA